MSVAEYFSGALRKQLQLIWSDVYSSSTIGVILLGRSSISFAFIVSIAPMYCSPWIQVLITEYSALGFIRPYVRIVFWYSPSFTGGRDLTIKQLSATSLKWSNYQISLNQVCKEGTSWYSFWHGNVSRYLSSSPFLPKCWRLTPCRFKSKLDIYIHWHHCRTKSTTCQRE